ncbi:MAG: hypothetical protein WCF90_00260 [Methanomicrobiales archaeon]
MIAKSYSRLKNRIIEAPARALGPINQTISSTIREHPLEAAATAVCGGIAAYGITRMMISNESTKERKKEPGEKNKVKLHHDSMKDTLSAILPVALQYLTCYLEKPLDYTKKEKY